MSLASNMFQISELCCKKKKLSLALEEGKIYTLNSETGGKIVKKLFEDIMGLNGLKNRKLYVGEQDLSSLKTHELAKKYIFYVISRGNFPDTITLKEIYKLFPLSNYKKNKFKKYFNEQEVVQVTMASKDTHFGNLQKLEQYVLSLYLAYLLNVKVVLMDNIFKNIYDDDLKLIFKIITLLNKEFETTFVIHVDENYEDLLNINYHIDLDRRYSICVNEKERNNKGVRYG